MELGRNLNILNRLKKSEELSAPKISSGDLSNLINSKHEMFTIEEIEGCPTIPTFHFFQTKLNFQNRDVVGTGESFNRNLALLRSVGEVLERVPLVADLPYWKTIYGEGEHDITTSNGLSFGYSPIECIHSSIRESVERHVVLDYWINKKESFEISAYSKKLPILNWLNGVKEGLNVRFIAFPNEFGLYVIACEISGKEDGPNLIYGYGCHQQLENALEKSFVEAWRFYWNYKFHPPKKSFSKEKVSTFIDHYYYFVTNRNITPFQSVKGLSLSKILSKFKNFSEIPISRISLFNLERVELKGYVSHVETELNQLFPGPLKFDCGKRKKGEIHPIA